MAGASPVGRTNFGFAAMAVVQVRATIKWYPGDHSTTVMQRLKE